MRVIDQPPKGLLSGGIYYPINTDFKVWLEVSELFEKGDRESLSEAVMLCYKDKIPPNTDEALYLMCEFFSGGKCENKGTGEKLLSLSADEELIYASFWSDYGIDLGNCSLHWWRFLALLKNLSADSALMRVIGIRASNPATIKNAETRRQLMRQKHLYSLKNENPEAGDVLSRLFGMEKGGE